MWYYAVNGQTFGPISEAELDAQARNGVITPDTFIWREGMSTWVPFRSRPGTPPPLEGGDLLPPAGAAIGDAQPLQGSSLRLESTSSWVMVAIICVAMFGFLGVLSSRPSIAEARTFSAAGLGDDDSETYGATVALQAGILTIQNNGDFDWPETTVTFDAAGKTYIYDLEKLPRNESLAVPLSRFTTEEGRNYAARRTTRGPSELDVEISGHGAATVPVRRLR